MSWIKAYGLEVWIALVLCGSILPIVILWKARQHDQSPRVSFSSSNIFFKVFVYNIFKTLFR